MFLRHGQADFAGNLCNRGRGVGAPDARSLCLRSPVDEGFVAGVGLDKTGNLWVADNQNNRVLLTAGYQADQATLLSMTEKAATYGADGSMGADRRTGLIDRNL